MFYLANSIGDKFELIGSKKQISKIYLFKTQGPFLYRLEDEKWITVVFYFNKQNEIQSVFSRGIDGKKVGIFASRENARELMVDYISVIWTDT